MNLKEISIDEQPIEGRVWVNHKLFFDLSNDRSSAEAIIFLWDWLEAQQDNGGIFNPLFFRNHDMKHEVRFPGKTGTDGPNFAGKTRIEALVRACVAVWKAKEDA